MSAAWHTRTSASFVVATFFATKTRNQEESPWVHSSCVLRVFASSWLHFGWANFVAYRASRGTYRCGYSGPTYSARGRMRRLFAYCSSTCAVHPEIRLTAKIGVKRSIGIPSAWYVDAE